VPDVHPVISRPRRQKQSHQALCSDGFLGIERSPIKSVYFFFNKAHNCLILASTYGLAPASSFFFQVNDLCNI
jgi:hypothetical protein